MLTKQQAIMPILCLSWLTLKAAYMKVQPVHMFRRHAKFSDNWP